MMEMFEGLAPDAIEAIPSTRRRRLILRKSELEKQRKARTESDMARSRSAARRGGRHR